MDMIRQITLPGQEQFYTRQYRFGVKLVPGACKTYLDPDSKPPASYPLQLDPNMLALLTGYGTSHSATLEHIARAAMQFYQTTTGPDEALDAVELSFMLMYEMGRALRNGTGATGPECLGAIKGGLRHPEIVKKTTEVFAYGLTLHYVASVIGVPVDWFTFIPEAGKKPDFRMSKPLTEILAMNPLLHTLGRTGQKIYIEVKSRTGWAGLREAGDSAGVLLDIAKKAAAYSDGIFLGVVIGWPKASKAPRRTPTILVADPNSPDPISIDEQVRFILRRYLALAHRYGLWKLKRDILLWLSDAGDKLTTPEKAELDKLDKIHPRSAAKQPFLPQRTIGQRVYVGRYFYTLLERLGSPGSRHLSKGEVEATLASAGFGTKYFAGVDAELAQIIGSRSHDPRRLLSFGVRGDGGVDLAGASAFRDEPAEMDDGDRARISDALLSALRRW